MNRLLAALLTLLLAAALLPGPVRAEVTGGIEFSSDSDDADRTLLHAGYRYYLEGTRQGPSLGFRTGVLTLTDPVGTERFRLLEISHRLRPARGADLLLKAGSLDGGAWAPVFYSGVLALRPGRGWYLEVSGERQIVDTVTSARLEYVLESYGLSADYAVTEEITLVGAVFEQRISDGNRRSGRVGRVVFSPRALRWLSLQAKARVLTSDLDGTGYFSPETLNEYFLLAGLAAPFADDNWVARTLAGPGIQRVKDHGGGTEEKPALLAEVRLRGWFTQEFGLEGLLGYTTTGSTGGGDRYVYGHVNLTHTLP